MPALPISADSGLPNARQRSPGVARSNSCSEASVEFIVSAVTRTSRRAVASGSGQLCAGAGDGAAAAAAATRTAAAARLILSTGLALRRFVVRWLVLR